MSIQVGRVRVVNGLNNVKVLWEAYLPGMASLAALGASVRATPSGARGRVTEHVLSKFALAFERTSSSSPSNADTYTTAAAASVDGRTVSLGTSNAATVSPSPGWTVDDFVGKWAALRPNLSTVEWRRISTNSVNQISVDENWTINPVSGDQLVIHDELSSAHGGWLNGSPVNWPVLGVAFGDAISISGVWYQVSSVTTDRVGISVPYDGVTADNLPYSIHRGYTPIGLPYLNPGDREIAGVSRKLATMIDSWFNPIPHIVGQPGEPIYVNSWTTPSAGLSSLRYFVVGTMCYVIGAAHRTSTPGGASTVYVLPVGVRPIETVKNDAGSAQVLSTGDFQWLSGPNTDRFFQLAFRIG